MEIATIIISSFTLIASIIFGTVSIQNEKNIRKLEHKLGLQSHIDISKYDDTKATIDKYLNCINKCIIELVGLKAEIAIKGKLIQNKYDEFALCIKECINFFTYNIHKFPKSILQDVINFNDSIKRIIELVQEAIKNNNDELIDYDIVLSSSLNVRNELTKYLENITDYL